MGCTPLGCMVEANVNKAAPPHVIDDTRQSYDNTSPKSNALTADYGSQGTNGAQRNGAVSPNGRKKQIAQGRRVSEWHDIYNPNNVSEEIDAAIMQTL